ncbi:hypothetical protein S40285_06660 [Stachybotrys chlorohalonatus IBT 40285]|uniref:Enoyl reductase (ER) domain-containing protein n=1 Tax=Stachybotrys chlorohalonatus (strain IBT 40285) TaxID=1283841 RepID=A0A084QX87_STAC4|nr:hypothetical protein S40285_06660 [Stachybotrys chlorohalonata IBT 40285]
MANVTNSHIAAVLHRAKIIKIEQVQTPELEAHQVQIAPRATGLCGTDLHYYQNGRNGIYTVEDPLLLGHEAAGEIIKVGSAVTNLQVGDRVAVEPQLPCSSCQQCRSGRYNLCPKMRFNGSASAKPPAQGSLQKVWTHPASLCYKLPSSVSFEEGAVVEPLSVALHSIRKGRLHAGQSVLITGAGAVGLLCARIAKISGASSVVMVDIDEARLQFALDQKLADRVFLAPTEGDPNTLVETTVEGIRNLLRPGANLALECTGIESCLEYCIKSAAPAARVVIVGMGRPVQQVNLGVAMVREIEIIGVWRYTNTFPAAIDLIEAGMVDVKPMITHRYDMQDVADALEYALSRPPDLVKCVITSN